MKAETRGWGGPVWRRLGRGLLGALALALMGLLGAVAWDMRRTPLPPETPMAAPDPAQVARGERLARAGNCMACHTARGGAPYAGGHGIDTPFGRLVAGNLTPDPETGLGAWSAQAFRRALHEGRSRDGRLLYPAFPYLHTTRLLDEDVDALWAHLRSLPPVRREAEPHALRFPYNTQAALALWRLMHFRPGRWVPETTRDTSWNRGAYLVEGVAHCAACHGPRNALGGPSGPLPLAGASMPDGRWHAPSLHDPAEGGVAGWPTERVVALLRDGWVPGASTLGPMAEVVFHGTQHLPPEDLRAMAVYLQALPQAPVPRPAWRPAEPAAMVRGADLYRRHCADCHGEQGQGAPGAYPALAGNRVLTQASPANTVQAILHGGFAPATAGHPRPHGMPPWRTVLNDAEIAALTSFLRQSWGHRASPVDVLEVSRLR